MRFPGQILKLEYLIRYNKYLQLCFGRPILEYWNIEQYNISTDLSWMSLYINLKRVMLIVWFLADKRIGIGGYQGRWPVLIEVL